MLDCVSHKNGEGNTVECDGTEVGEDDECGSDTAYAYFISFYVLCSFLVSISLFFFYRSFKFLETYKNNIRWNVIDN